MKGQSKRTTKVVSAGQMPHDDLSCFAIIALMGFRDLGLTFFNEEKRVAHLALSDDRLAILVGLTYERIRNFTAFRG